MAIKERDGIDAVAENPSQNNSQDTENVIGGLESEELARLGNIDSEIDNSFTIKNLLDMGIHFGHAKEETRPMMRKNYIYCSANGLDIFDLEKTEAMLKKALRKIYDIIMDGKSVIIVCTKKSSAAQLIKDIAQECGQCYITRRWIPGFLTNKETIKKSMDKLKLLQVAFASSKAPNRIKRFQAAELNKRHLKVEGVTNCKSDEIGAIVSIYCDNLGILAHECAIAKVDLIAVCDSNTKDDVLEKVNYVIPGNDDAVKAHFLYGTLIKKVIRRAFENLLKILKKMEVNQDTENKSTNDILQSEDLQDAKNRKYN
jgi:small subunit ribosomal protein S2